MSTKFKLSTALQRAVFLFLSSNFGRSGIVVLKDLSRCAGLVKDLDLVNKAFTIDYFYNSFSLCFSTKLVLFLLQCHQIRPIFPVLARSKQAIRYFTRLISINNQLITLAISASFHLSIPHPSFKSLA